MKRYGLLLILSVLLILASPGSVLAAFPRPDGSVVLPLGEGWFNGNQAWFISTDTTDISLAGQQRLTLFEGIPTGAAPVYMVTNPAQPQGPVFSAAPDPVPRPYPPPPYYSGIWRMVYVTWNSGAPRVPLMSEQQILDLESTQALSLLWTQSAVDYSIMAVGPLGRPDYLIPQAEDISLATREIQLPTWNTFGYDPMSGRTIVKRVIVPDAFTVWGPAPGNLDLTTLIGANPAYGLGSTGPLDNVNALAAIDWVQFSPNGGAWPVSPDQFLISRDSPTACGTANMDSGYSPFARMTVMVRFPFVPSNFVFSDWGQVASSPGLTGVYGAMVNAPVLCP